MSARPTTTLRTERTPSGYVVRQDGTRAQRTYPEDISARDCHEAAAGRFAREVLGYTFPVLDYSGRQPSHGYRFSVTDAV